MPPLAGSRALVIGGARRLGRAIALGLAQHGADVAVTARTGGADAEATADAIRALGRSSAGARVRRALDRGRSRDGGARAPPPALGGLDVLVYAAAGGFRAARPHDVDAALFDEAVGTILRGGFFAAQAAQAQMAADGGVIVFITDVAAMQAWPSFAPHSVAKAGLVHLTEVLAKAWAPGVRVCGVAPGTVLPEAGQRRSLARARRERRGARPRRLARRHRGRRALPGRGRLRDRDPARRRRRATALSCGVSG